MSKFTQFFGKMVILSAFVALPLFAAGAQDNGDQSGDTPAPFEDQGEIARGSHGGGGGGGGGWHGGGHGGGGEGHWHGGEGHHGDWNNNYWYGGWGGVGIYPYYDGYNGGYNYYPDQNYYYYNAQPSNGTIYYYDTGAPAYDNSGGGVYFDIGY